MRCAKREIRPQCRPAAKIYVEPIDVIPTAPELLEPLARAFRRFVLVRSRQSVPPPGSHSGVAMPSIKLLLDDLQSSECPAGIRGTWTWPAACVDTLHVASTNRAESGECSLACLELSVRRQPRSERCAAEFSTICHPDTGSTGQQHSPYLPLRSRGRSLDPGQLSIDCGDSVPLRPV